ncbi:hypothetical protein [Spirosoma rhododendri]|uniref:hypothetical protein n=1 Tax=Spirosoma rhododendri TaxID=2728024 RepID=UPI001582DC70|nr:hypothetical protein [Spirosoma rhododendri]
MPTLLPADTSTNSKSTLLPTGSPILPPISADWVATDGAGRSLLTRASTGPFRPNKYVGIFYFLLQGQYGDKAVYDISSLLRKNASAPQYGPENAWHWWGEPEVGYFKSDDPWVIRRNLQLLTIAGVDILFLDVTNGDTYTPVIHKLCSISSEMRHQGIPTPYICFVTYTRSPNTVAVLYNEFYSKNLYSELWFRWQGKPLILGKEGEMTDASIRNFFTWRYSWAWTNARNEPHHWQWLDRTPQNYGWDKNPSIPEEIPVAVASHPYDNNIGKSFRKGKTEPTARFGVTQQTRQGTYFNEQWQRALQVDPEVVFVTGWNEWVAQRHINKVSPSARTKAANFLGRPLKQGQTFFIDLYNEEYNRDIDPMKGGYSDNYYYQLVANIRRFKGLPAPSPVSPPRTIIIDGKFDEWQTVTPYFVDPVGDTMHRNWPGADNKLRYINTTGRNDIVGTKVTHDAKNIYFYARTSQKLTSSMGKNWMLLFIDIDQSDKTGWSGYDLLLNQQVNGNATSVSRWNGKSWSKVGVANLRYAANELEIGLPKSVVKQTGKTLRIDFHWADNIQRLNDITEFFLHGDSAPDRRFQYRYSG